MARDEDEGSPGPAAPDVEPTSSEVGLRQAPIDLGTALDVAQVGLELMALVLAVPKGRAAAEAMARKVGAVIDALRPPFSAPGDAEAFLVRDAIHGWLDARYGLGLWVVEEFVMKREPGRVVVALEEARTGRAHRLVVSLDGYDVLPIL